MNSNRRAGRSTQAEKTDHDALVASYLEIYLNDHGAGAEAGLALVRRILNNNAGTAWVEDLQWVADRVESDEQMLATLRRQLGVQGGTVKRVLALVVERFSRLKMNGRFAAYSPLSRVIELEALMSGIAAKQSLWVAMQTAPNRGALTGFDFPGLERSARAQVEILARIHREAASLVFSPAKPA